MAIGIKKTGTSKNEILNGTDDDDHLFGVAGNDQLFGGAGDDLLDGGRGNDKLYAGAGNDTLVYVAAENKGAVDLYDGGSGIDTLRLVLTQTEWLLPKVQADLQRFVDFVDANVDSNGEANNTAFAFSAFRLTEAALEKLDVTVAGATTIVGTNDDDFGFGSDAADLISGLRGSDYILANAGADVVFGGDGNDYIVGGAGNDVLDGGSGDDTLADDDGDNRVTGGAGDDYIELTFNSSAIADAGDGNDFLWVYSNLTANVNAGAGNDTVYIYGTGSHQKVFGGTGDDYIILYNEPSGVVIDAGPGNDLIDVNPFNYKNTITTGSGSDTIQMLHFLPLEPLVITDFDPGPGGDVMSLDPMLPLYLNGWDESKNPFATGFLRLLQSGKNTLFQIDTDGLVSDSTWVTFATLQRVNVKDVTSNNFLPGYDPHEPMPPVPPSVTINGTEQDDRIEGGLGSDKLYGFGGADLIIGNAGDDLIDGGDGNDTIVDNAGSNDITGGEGDDVIETAGPLVTGWPRTVVYSGAGNDTVRVSGGCVTVLGDDGNDHISLVNTGQEQSIQTGLGSDTIVVAGYSEHGVRVSDFTPGAGGDVLDYSEILAATSWDGVANPFQAGFLQFQESGIDTILRVDADGAAGASSTYVTAITLEKMALTALISANVAPYYDFLPPSTIVGTDNSETLTGTSGNNIILGRGGDDFLYGLDGDDTIDGGDGNDYLSGGTGDDRLEDHTGDNVFDGGAGNDTIVSFNGNTTTVAAGEGNNTIQIQFARTVNITAGAGDDRIEVTLSSGGPVTINAGDGNNSINAPISGQLFITTGSGSDSVTAYGSGTVETGDGSDNLTIAGSNANAGAGNDRIEWNLGSSLGVLTTGPGADIVTPRSAHDHGVLTDFQVGPSGDALDLRSMLAAHTDASNIGQFVQLTSDGVGGSNFVVDIDGPLSQYGPSKVFVLQHVSGFTAADLLLSGNLLVF